MWQSKRRSISKFGRAELEPLPPDEEMIETEIDIDKEELESSKLNAMAAAFKKAEVIYDYEHEGWEILEDDEDIGLIKGDLLLEVEGISLKQPDEFYWDELIEVYEEKEVGDFVHYKVLREGKIIDVESEIIEEDGEKYDEVDLYSIKRQKIYFSSPVKVEFQDDEDSGGPSGGLMMALAIYDKLVPEDLTKGYKIAGTGTISADGRVGMIGSENFKVMGADASGAKIFFCPEGNDELARETVKKFGLSIEVVPVDTLDEAVDYLRNMR
jgi:PDZ domain-containing protein